MGRSSLIGQCLERGWSLALYAEAIALYFQYCHAPFRHAVGVKAEDAVAADEAIGISDGAGLEIRSPGLLA